MIPRTNKQRLVGVAVLVVTFLAGGFAGAAVREVTADPTPRQATREPDGRTDERRENDRRFPFEYLKIEGQQRADIEALFARNHEATSAVWHEYKPKFDAIVDSTRAELNRMLTPEQREKFAEYRKRRREQRSEGSDSARSEARN